MTARSPLTITGRCISSGCAAGRPPRRRRRDVGRRDAELRPAVAAHEVGRRILELVDDRAQRRLVRRRVEVAHDVDVDAQLLGHLQRLPGLRAAGVVVDRRDRPWRPTLGTPRRGPGAVRPRRRSGHRRRLLRQRRHVRRRGRPGCPSCSASSASPTPRSASRSSAMGLGGLAVELVQRPAGRPARQPHDDDDDVGRAVAVAAGPRRRADGGPGVRRAARARRARRADRRGDELPGRRAAAAPRALDHHPLPRRVVGRRGDRRPRRQPRRGRRDLVARAPARRRASSLAALTLVASRFLLPDRRRGRPSTPAPRP